MAFESCVLFPRSRLGGLNSATIQIVEYSNRRKNQGYSKRRKNSIAAIIFRL